MRFYKAHTLIRNKGYDLKRGNTLKIMVAGIEKGVGVTHFSILLANYLRCVLKKKTAIIDFNNDEDYIYLGRRKGKKVKENIYDINGVAYYPRAMNKLNEILSCEYECVIIDVGTSYNKYNIEAAMCDKRFILLTASLWKEECFNTDNDRERDYNLDNWNKLFIFGDIDEYTKDIKKIPFTANPYKVNREMIDVLAGIIREE